MSLRNHHSREVVRALCKYYKFEIDRQSGSHILLKHPDGRRVTVVRTITKPIKEGTMKSILSQANISREEFLKYI